MLAGIHNALEADGGFEIVGETLDGTDVLAIVERTRPDLVILDVRMASTSPELIAAALRRGASAYLSKSVDPTDLTSTLRQVLEGNVWRQSSATGEDVEASGKGFGLTDRETAILQALARGLSNDEIAKELWVTQQTVKFHLTNIYRKLGAKNRTQATRIAQQHGLVDSPLFGDEE